jgi:hypothetical protein
MTLTSLKPKVKRCKGFIIENGGYRCRWIDEITLVVDGKFPKTLRGDKLPHTVVLDTGRTVEAKTVLEFFYEKVPPPLVQLSVERSPGLNGRDVAVGIAAVVVVQVLLAFANAVAGAWPL